MCIALCYHFCLFCNVGRYCFNHLFQKLSSIIWLVFHCFSDWGKITWIIFNTYIPVRKCIRVRTFKSFKAQKMLFFSLEIKILSTSMRNMFSNSYFEFSCFKILYDTLNWFDNPFPNSSNMIAKRVLNVHLIFRMLNSDTILLWNSWRFLFHLKFNGLIVLAINLLIASNAESVFNELINSLWIALLLKPLKKAPYCLSVLLLNLTISGPK